MSSIEWLIILLWLTEIETRLLQNQKVSHDMLPVSQYNCTVGFSHAALQMFLILEWLAHYSSKSFKSIMLLANVQNDTRS